MYCRDRRQHQRRAGPDCRGRPAVIKAISDAVDFAVCELRDTREAGSTDYLRLLS
jgi:hypothetical protein